MAKIRDLKNLKIKNIFPIDVNRLKTIQQKTKTFKEQVIPFKYKATVTNHFQS